MNISTYSPGLVVVFAFLLLSIFLDVRFLSFNRQQTWCVSVFIVVAAVGNHILRYLVGSEMYSLLLFFSLHLPLFFLFLWLSKCGVIKMAFTIMSAVVFTSPSVIIGNVIKRLVPNHAWPLLLANVLTYAIILVGTQVFFRKSFNYIIKYGDNRDILRFAPVPFLYYAYLFAVANVDFSALSGLGGTIIRFLPTFYVFACYFMLLNSYQNIHEKQHLETAQTILQRQLNAAKDQIAQLSHTQTQTAYYQHNLRHHLTAISAFLSAGKPEQAAEYIRQAQADVEEITVKRFCENELVNLLCTSFAQKAENLGIRLTIDANLPKDLSISDTALCSVLSNALENAIHATEPLERELKWVTLSCGIQWNKFFIEVQNPYEGVVTIRDGLPVTHRKGHGYGCRSIRSIAVQNNGLCIFDAEGGVFTLQLAFPLNK